MAVDRSAGLKSEKSTQGILFQWQPLSQVLYLAGLGEQT